MLCDMEQSDEAAAPPKMTTASTADAAGGDYTRVRMRLTGRLTPLRRRQTSLASSSCDGNSDSTESRGEYEEEADLGGLLDAAVVRAEQERTDLRHDDAWRRVLDLLPMLAEAQALLLKHERNRCRAVEERRGRASRVRFLCYDLSAVDPPRPAGADGSAELDGLLGVLARLISAQRSLLESVPPPERDVSLVALTEALRAESTEQPSARSKRACAWCADAVDALQRDGTLMLEGRLSELLGSQLRFHLHSVFDKPSRSAVKLAERGEAGRELLANDAARDSRGATMRFYIPRAETQSESSPMATAGRSQAVLEGAFAASGCCDAPGGPPGVVREHDAGSAGSAGESAADASGDTITIAGASNGGAFGGASGSGAFGSGSAFGSAFGGGSGSAFGDACSGSAGSSSGAHLTAALRRELTALELVSMPLNGEMGPLGQRNYGSLGSLLSHALTCWAEHVELATGSTMRGYLEQRDLYARLSLKALHAQQQADMLAWAEAHTVLTFIAKDGLLERFAWQSPASWESLCRLGEAARAAGCTDESPYALLADGERLRTLIADTSTIATKLMRLLPWCANPLAANSNKSGGTRLRTMEKETNGDEGDRLQKVRVRHAGAMWERVLDWDEIAVVREPSPGRDKGSLLPGTGPRFGRQNLRDFT